MAQYQTGDGRWLVGDVTGESNYHGFLGWRDCVIQLTGEGATEQSVHYLEALRDYALAHNPLGEPIMPPSINVWISNNGTTTAVQADDLSIDGDKFTIGGIVWDGSTWDYSDAGKASGGGSGSGYTVTEERVVVIPEQTVTASETSIDHPGYSVFLAGVSTTSPDSLTVTFDGTKYNSSKKNLMGMDYYGATITIAGTSTSVDWSEAPFIVMMGDDAQLIVETESTHTIKSEAITKVVEVSDDFKKAVESAVGTQEDIYDLELVYRESKGDYSARIPGDGLPIDNMITLLDSHKAFYFYIPDGNSGLGLRVFVDCINRAPTSVYMSGSYIKNGTLSVYSGSMTNRNTSLLITKTDYTLTPAT